MRSVGENLIYVDELKNNLVNIYIHKKKQDFKKPYSYSLSQLEFKN